MKEVFSTKKSLLIFSMILILAIVLIGCANQPGSIPNSGKSGQSNQDNSTTPYQFNYPENFTSSVDFESVKVPERLDRYAGNCVTADEAAIRNILTEQNPNGDFNISVSPKMLLIRDRNSKTYSRLTNLARLIPGEGTLTFAQNGAINNDDFRAWENLDNLPSVATVLGELKEVFDAAGLENLTPVEVYALDAEALKAHEMKRAELFDQDLAEGEDPYEIYDWGTDDSCNLVIYTNRFDGIPFYYRQNLVIGDRFIPMTYAYAFYGKDGLIGMEGHGLYEKGVIEGSDAPLSVEEIMNVFLADMRELIHVPGTKLTAVELCYLALPIGDYTDLVPIWAFEVTSQGLDRPIPEPYPRQFVGLYDAFTGDICDVRYAGMIQNTPPSNENWIDGKIKSADLG